MKIYLRQKYNYLTLYIFIVPNCYLQIGDSLFCFSSDVPEDIMEIQLYEIAFNNELINILKYLPNTVEESCSDCGFYSNCKRKETIVKYSNETNKIIKELKEIISNGGD